VWIWFLGGGLGFCASYSLSLLIYGVDFACCIGGGLLMEMSDEAEDFVQMRNLAGKQVDYSYAIKEI